jgi:hypothetical protein
MNDEQYRMAELERKHADTRRRCLALEVEVDRLATALDRVCQALRIVDLG